MAKGFHYFKFIATEWLTGDIVFEDFELQGIFINICALYWHRDGILSIEEIEKRLKTNRLPNLTDRFISVKDGFISIKFLDEQLIEAGHVSKTNSINGKKGGRPKATPPLQSKPTANRPLTDRKANESQIELEIELKESKIKYSITVGSKKIEGTTSEWLMANKESAIEVLLMKTEYHKLKLEDVFKVLNSETNQYHFKDDNHPYNYFKLVCDRLIKPASKFQKEVTETPKYKQLK